MHLRNKSERNKYRCLNCGIGLKESEVVKGVVDSCPMCNSTLLKRINTDKF